MWTSEAASPIHVTCLSHNGGVCVDKQKGRIFLYQMKALVEKPIGLKY